MTYRNATAVQTPMKYPNKRCASCQVKVGLWIYIEWVRKELHPRTRDLESRSAANSHRPKILTRGIEPPSRWFKANAALPLRLSVSSAPDRTRTCNLQLRRLLPYPVGLRGQETLGGIEPPSTWFAARDVTILSQRPTSGEGLAPPASWVTTSCATNCATQTLTAKCGLKLFVHVLHHLVGNIFPALMVVSDSLEPVVGVLEPGLVDHNGSGRIRTAITPSFQPGVLPSELLQPKSVRQDSNLQRRGCCLCEAKTHTLACAIACPRSLQPRRVPRRNSNGRSGTSQQPNA